MSHTSHRFERSGGPKMGDQKGFEASGGPSMPKTSGGFESAPNNPTYGKEKGSRYPNGNAKQDSYYKPTSGDKESM